MPTVINGTTGITFTDNTVQNTAAINFRNRIINGGMVIDQRNAGASVTQGTGNLFPVDRFLIVGTVTSKFTAQRSTTVPAGFRNSVICTSSSAYTVGAAETFVFTQRIEGFNVADLGWGAAGAQTVTLSFWVRSSLTGAFGGSIRNSATNRSYPFSYTINSANTFEYKTITIPGDTSGTWLTDENTGINLTFSLGTGSTLSGTAGAWAGSNFTSATGATSVVGTNGATFYITGVQLERGSTASSFDFRSYGQELALCQRYYQRLQMEQQFPAGGAGSTLTVARNFFVPMRTTPTMVQVAAGSTTNVSSATLAAVNASEAQSVLVGAAFGACAVASRVFEASGAEL
jgi:hypothetical protein